MAILENGNFHRDFLKGLWDGNSSKCNIPEDVMLARLTTNLLD